MAGSVECLSVQLSEDGCSSNKSASCGVKSADWLAGVFGHIRRWRSLARQRRDLARLSDEMLKDIGISRVDALREAKRPFWDDPMNRDL